MVLLALRDDPNVPANAEGLHPSFDELSISKYLADGSYSADQITFVKTIVGDLSHNGVMEPKALYGHPYKDHAPTGPDDLFDQEEAAEIVSIIRWVSGTARVSAVGA